MIQIKTFLTEVSCNTWLQEQHSISVKILTVNMHISCSGEYTMTRYLVVYELMGG